MFRLAGARGQLEEAACRDPGRTVDLQIFSLTLFATDGGWQEGNGTTFYARFIRPTLAAGLRSVSEAPSTKTYTRLEANTCNSMGGRASKKKVEIKVSSSNSRGAGHNNKLSTTQEGGRVTKNCEKSGCRPPIRGGIKEKLSKSSFRPPTQGGGGLEKQFLNRGVDLQLERGGSHKICRQLKKGEGYKKLPKSRCRPPIRGGRGLGLTKKMPSSRFRPPTRA